MHYWCDVGSRAGRTNERPRSNQKADKGESLCTCVQGKKGGGGKTYVHTDSWFLVSQHTTLISVSEEPCQVETFFQYTHIHIGYLSVRVCVHRCTLYFPIKDDSTQAARCRVFIFVFKRWVIIWERKNKAPQLLRARCFGYWWAGNFSASPGN